MVSEIKMYSNPAYGAAYTSEMDINPASTYASTML